MGDLRRPVSSLQPSCRIPVRFPSPQTNFSPYIPLSASPVGRGAGGEGELRASETVVPVRNALTLSQRERGFIENRKTCPIGRDYWEARANGPVNQGPLQSPRQRKKRCSLSSASWLRAGSGGLPLGYLGRFSSIRLTSNWISLRTSSTSSGDFRSKMSCSLSDRPVGSS